MDFQHGFLNLYWKFSSPFLDALEHILLLFVHEILQRIHEGTKKWEKGIFIMGRNYVTGIPGIVPKEEINKSGIGTKIQG